MFISLQLAPCVPVQRVQE